MTRKHQLFLAAISIFILSLWYIWDPEWIPFQNDVKENIQTEVLELNEDFSANNDTNFSQEDLDHLPLCDSQTFTKGKWVYTPIFDDSVEEVTPESVMKYTGFQCPENRFNCLSINLTETLRSKRALDYTWVPNNCRLLPFNATAFTDYLSSHPLLLVGDSMGEQHFTSLACMLGSSINVPDETFNTPSTYGDSMYNGGVLYHSTNLRYVVGFVWSEFLVHTSHMKILTPLQASREESWNNNPWAHLLHQYSYKYVVLTTGPHWTTHDILLHLKSKEPLLMAYERMIKNVLKWLKQNLAHDVKVFVRGTPFGHEGCTNAERPVNNINLPSEEQYNWAYFTRMNSMWKKSIAELADPRIIYFDIILPTVLRPDGHKGPPKDCVHYCIPGPIDLWNRFLYHEIMKNVQEQL